MARNILQMALPMTVAQLINILYNIVDRMYLGRLPGHLSLTGLGLCLPIISILMGFANLCGMGGAPLCSIHRGKGENEEAERILGNSFTLLLLFGGGLTVFCLAFRRPILYLFGASDLTFPYANDYLTIYLLGTLFVMIGLGMNPFINAQGFSRMGMMTVALGAAVNIVLDPIFIFALDMGVRGAALATVLAQGCSALWVLKFLTGRRALLRLRWNTLRLQAARVRRILALGTSGFVMSMTNSLVQVLCLPSALRRRPLRGGDDRHQLHPGGGVHAGAGHHQRLPAGAGLQLRRGGVRAGAPGDPVHHGAYGGLLRGGVGAGYGRARAAHPYL